MQRRSSSNQLRKQADMNVKGLAKALDLETLRKQVEMTTKGLAKVLTLRPIFGNKLT